MKKPKRKSTTKPKVEGTPYVSLSPLNKAVTRRIILNRIAILRPALVGKLTRVSEGTFEYLAYRLRNVIDTEVQHLSTVGATIRIGGR